MTDVLESPERREPARLSGILKIGAALFVLALAVLLLILDPLPEVKAGVELASHFEVRELPFGFRVERAHRLMTQELVVALEADDPRVATTPDVELAPDADDVPVDEVDEELEDDASAEDPERHALDDGTPPSLVYLVRYPSKQARRVLEQQMRRHAVDMSEQRDEGKDKGDGGKQGGKERLLTIDGGRLPWGDFDADFVLERKFTSDGHFEDVMRVNLTRGQQCWVLFAVWPRDYRGSREPVEALLDALLPV